MFRTGHAPEDIGDRRRVEGAAWALCLLLSVLLAAALAPRLDAASLRSSPYGLSSELPDCKDPREAAAVRGFTSRVACGPPAGGGRPVRGPARWLFGLRIDLVDADARLLESLPGIGPARAASIVAARRGGGWTSVDDLDRVHGIGPRTVERLRPLLCFGPPTTIEASRASPGGPR